MLEIHYVVSKNSSQEYVKTYVKPSDFLAAQYKEVPDLQDNYIINEVLIDNKKIPLEDKTVLGLFNYLKK